MCKAELSVELHCLLMISVALQAAFTACYTCRVSGRELEKEVIWQGEGAYPSKEDFSLCSRA